MNRGLILLPFFVTLCAGQSFTPTNPAALAARQWRQQHERAIVDEFVALLAIPNISRDRANIQRNAEAIAAMMQKRGIAAKLVAVPDSNPVVFGEIKTPGATRTIVLYAHYDGQPLDPKEWATPPFAPVLRDKQFEKDGQVIPLPAPGARFDPEWRLYARSAGDDKAPIIAMLAAVDAIRAAGIQTKSNIKFAFEGEEEAGSTNLEKILAANKDLFSGDVWLMCDGPVHQTRRQLIYFGARAITQIDITLYGPRGELHSGHYGNWAPNPAMELAKLLASMKDDNGRVLVEHFYDDVQPLSATEKRATCRGSRHRRGPDARVRAGFNRRRREEASGVDYAAVAEHSRHGQFARWGASFERNSVDCHSNHGYSAGERYGPAANLRARVGPYPQARLFHRLSGTHR